MSERERIAIIFDGEAWFVRRIERSVHNLSTDQKEYYCDKHISGPHHRLEDVPQVIAVFNGIEGDE